MRRLITANKAPSRIDLAHKSTDTTLRCVTTHIIVAEIMRQVPYSHFSIHCLPNVDIQVVNLYYVYINIFLSKVQNTKLKHQN